MTVIDRPPTDLPFNVPNLPDPSLTPAEKGFLSFLDMLLDVQPWMAEGNCRGMDTEDPTMFFPSRGESQRNSKAICNPCPVIEQCGKYAWENDLLGVWGGLSWRERSRKWGGKQKSQ